MRQFISGQWLQALYAADARGRGEEEQRLPATLANRTLAQAATLAAAAAREPQALQE